MHESEETILARELAAVAAAAGGSGRLTGLITRMMKKNVHEVDLVIPLPFETTVERVVAVLEREGRRIEPIHADPGADRQTVRVVTSGGTGGMNPVVVTALVTKGEERDSGVKLRAAAKEGLVKQRAGEQTATRLAALLVK